ncbi:MAG: histidine phosphatase family protein [Planctomycetales bacterium]|nr:histidine phosphatase family protein [Planctomycetales bacterium]
MELLLIRHAQSANNALPEHRRVEDPGITDLGQRQAAALAAAFGGWQVDHLITSAFRRALMTTHAIYSAGQAPTPVVWTELHESGGCYAGHEPGRMVGRPGMNAREIASHFPGFRISGEIPDTGWWSSRPWETDEQARDRARGQARRLSTSFAAAERVACVIHADFKAMLLAELLGDAWRDWQHVSLCNTGVTRLHCESSGARVLAFNNLDHLDPSLVSD